VVSATFLWFSLTALPGVFVSSTIDTCSADSFGRALRMMRPDVAIGLGPAPDREGSVEVVVTARKGEILLAVSGHGRSINRTFPDPNDCESACQTAALIIDRALEDLQVSETTPTIETLAPPPSPFALLAALGAGGTQGVFGAAATLNLALQLQWLDLALFTLSGDFLLPSGRTLPDGLGTMQASGEILEFGAGVSPHLGPGRLNTTALFGITWTNLTSNTSLPENYGRTAAEPYVGLAVGYALGLPDHFFLSIQLEEQLALGRTEFVVEGESNVSAASTRTWTFQAWLAVGRRLF
jgi:hypothetical protein